MFCHLSVVLCALTLGKVVEDQEEVRASGHPDDIEMEFILAVESSERPRKRRRQPDAFSDEVRTPLTQYHRSNVC